MAYLGSIQFTPHRAEIGGSDVRWVPVKNGRAFALPQLFWADGSPWREPNLWFMERATSQSVSLKTVLANATALLGYTNWLEESHTQWWDFPPRKGDRCLVRYRGALVDARDSAELAPATVSQRMRAVIAFYRWMTASGLLSTDWPLWNDRIFGIRIADKFGLERTFTVLSADLNIANRKAPGERLEDGLLPLRSSDRDCLLDFAKSHASEELFLMLTLGFFTGMRLGTLTDLKVESLNNAFPDPAAPGLYRIPVGPGANPSVHTKFGVPGHIWITRTHLDELLNYAGSLRRLKREVRATAANKNLVFLTRFGNRYAERGVDKSVAVNVEMHSFRRLAVAQGLSFLAAFHFHQTRCTCRPR